MKVFALGGYGKVGLPAIKLLAQSDLVTEIAVAGRNLQRAKVAATEIGEKAIAVHADGTDEHKLTSLLAGYDIIMNAADNEFVLPSIRAAMHHGAHYCDVAWGNVLDQALQLTSEAKAAGVTAIVANGIAPSISNLMGVHVARQLEEVEQLQLGDAGIYNFGSGQQLTPRQWIEEPRQSLAALNEFRPGITMMLQMAQESGGRTVCIPTVMAGGWRPILSGAAWTCRGCKEAQSDQPRISAAIRSLEAYHAISLRCRQWRCFSAHSHRSFTTCLSGLHCACSRETSTPTLL